MFANVFTLIVALLIYSSYQPPESAALTATQSVLAAVLLNGVFLAIIELRTTRLRLQTRQPLLLAEHRGEALQRQHTVLAVILFAIEIYGLNLPMLLTDRPPFAQAPTLLGLFFITILLLRLIPVWLSTHASQRGFAGVRLSRRQIVGSQLATAIPVLLPWALFSGVADLLRLLPLELPRKLLSTALGEATYFALMMLLVAILGPAIIQRFWRCRPLAPGFYRSRMEALAERAGMRFHDIVYWPIFGGQMLTAGVMGLVQRFRYLLVTQALLTHLDPEEVDAVVAHEIGHVKRHHLPLYLLFFTGYLLLSYALLDLALLAIVAWTPMWRLPRDLGISQGTLISVLFSSVLLTAFMLYFRFVFGYFMRQFERQADLFVFRLFASARPLISTLEKIARLSGQARERPNWHHYSIAQRVAYLQACEADRSWIARHERTVRRGMIGYLVALLACAVLGYQLNFGVLGKRVSGDLLLAIVQRQLVANPAEGSLYRLLGDLHTERQRVAEAIRAYEQAVQLDPEDPHSLNNLAWLLVTAEDRQLRDPARALELARQAAMLLPQPFVLDTLAECLFANGRTAEAFKTAQRALAAANGNNLNYYRGQMERFRRLAEGV